MLVAPALTCVLSMRLQLGASASSLAAADRRSTLQGMQRESG